MDTPIELLDALRYEDGKLYYRVNKGKMRAGAEAGNTCRGRYLGVGHYGKKYAVHRLVWELHHGPIPANRYVDHISRDFLDNRIENLRLVDYAENSANSSRGSNRNCYWHEPTKSWHVRVQFRGELHHGGYFKCLDTARACAAAFRQRIHREYAGGAVEITTASC